MLTWKNLNPSLFMNSDKREKKKTGKPNIKKKKLWRKLLAESCSYNEEEELTCFLIENEKHVTIATSKRYEKEKCLESASRKEPAPMARSILMMEGGCGFCWWFNRCLLLLVRLLVCGLGFVLISWGLGEGLSVREAKGKATALVMKTEKELQDKQAMLFGLLVSPANCRAEDNLNIFERYHCSKNLRSILFGV